MLVRNTLLYYDFVFILRLIIRIFIAFNLKSMFHLFTDKAKKTGGPQNKLFLSLIFNATKQFFSYLKRYWWVRTLSAVDQK